MKFKTQLLNKKKKTGKGNEKVSDMIGTELIELYLYIFFYDMVGRL